VAAEAMLTGLPGIVTIGGGPSEYVEDGVTGLHVRCNDVGHMADAIEKLLSSPVLRKHLGEAARRHAVTAFDPATLAERTTEVYHRVLNLAARRFRKPCSVARREPVLNASGNVPYGKSEGT
jgi:glycosyltransferase involved in cell wall biosynthesis